MHSSASPSRRGFIAGLTMLAVAAGATGVRAADAASELKIRWYGGGVYELATPDDATIVLVDAWIWNNTGFTRFGIPKPPELASAAAYADSIKARNPKTFVVAVTHDHGDHFGDYFELLKVLTDKGIDVKSVGQSDFMRFGIKEKFAAAGLSEEKIVLNGGQGINFGGVAAVGGARFMAVPAIHSMESRYPPIGFIIDINGVRVYASGDTDLYGDMALIGKRFKPDLAMVCAGGGPYTMDPESAAMACAMVAPPHAIPVHYGHNPLIHGPEAGAEFKAALARVAPKIAATIMKPGETARLSFTARSRA